MQGSDVLKYGLFAVGGYLLYQKLSGGGSLSNLFTMANQLPAGNTPTTGAAAANAMASTTGGSTPTPSVDLRSLMMAKAGDYLQQQGGLLNGDQWSYYFTEVRGVPGPDTTAVWKDRDRSYKMTIDEDLGATGLRGGIGMGTIVPYKFPEGYLRIPPAINARGYR